MERKSLVFKVIFFFLIALSSGCGGGGSGEGPTGTTDPAPTNPYVPPERDAPKSIGPFPVNVMVTGLDGGGELTLALNGVNSLRVSGSGIVQFEERLPKNTQYAVSVSQQPGARTCFVERGDGVMPGAPVSTPRVECWSSVDSLQLRAESGFGRISLRWNKDVPAEVRFSTDPECDWSAVNGCNDGGILAGAASGVTLDITNGLAFDKDWFFVVNDGSAYSNVAGGTVLYPAFDDLVRTIKPHDSRLYVGGQFKFLRSESETGVIINTATGLPASANLPFEPGSAMRAEDGGWYLIRTPVYGGHTFELEKTNVSGALDPGWTSLGLSGFYELTLLQGGRLFLNTPSIHTPHFIVVDAQTGSLLQTIDGKIIGHDETRLFVVREEKLLALNSTDYSELDWSPPAGVLPDPRSVVSAGGKLFITGRRELKSGNRARTYAHSHGIYDEDTGMQEEWWRSNQDITGWVAIDGVLYVGGFISKPEYVVEPYLHAYDIATGARLDWTVETDDAVTPLYANDRTLFIRQESRAGDGLSWVQGIDRRTAELSEWHSNEFAPVAFDGEFAVYGPGSAAGVRRNGLLALDISTARLIDDWNPDVRGDGFRYLTLASGAVTELTVYDDTLYLGGEFLEVSGHRRVRLAAVNLAKGELLAWHPSVHCPGHNHVSTRPTLPCRVTGISIYNDKVFVAGEFTHVNDDLSKYRVRLAAFDMKYGSALAINNDFPLIVGVLQDAMLSGDHFVLGGQFTVDQQRRTVTAIRLNTGRETFGLDEDGIVNALANLDGNILLGANFRHASDSSLPDLRLVRPASWTVTSWGEQPSRPIGTLAVSSTAVHVGPANFSSETFSLEAFDRVSGDRASDGALFEERGAITALASANGVLYVGGVFSIVNGKKRPWFVALDAATGELVW